MGERVSMEKSIVSEPVSGFDGYLTLDDAAQVCGMSYWAMRRLIASRSIPCKRIGATLLVPLAIVQREVGGQSRQGIQGSKESRG